MLGDLLLENSHEEEDILEEELEPQLEPSDVYSTPNKTAVEDPEEEHDYFPHIEAVAEDLEEPEELSEIEVDEKISWAARQEQRTKTYVIADDDGFLDEHARLGYDLKKAS